MTDETTVTRRTVLAASTVGAGAIALAACSSGSGAGPSTKDASTPPNAPLAKLDAITVGQAVSAKLPDGKPAIVARPSADTAACFSAKCTHMGCTVAPAGNELHCPCHGSIYDATTGAVIHGPAPKALPKIAVQVTNGEVVTS